MTSQSIEDYIKAIFQLGQDAAPVSTSALAERLDVRPASVSNMLRRLEALELVRYEPYHGVELTGDGERLGRRMIRRHRLIERFLTEVLDYEWDEVHEEAERLEHAVSPRFIDAIDGILERPETDPHGDPIPTAEGILERTRYPDLTDVPPGSRVTVRRVSDMDSELLRLYRRLGIEPDARLRVLDTDRAGDTIQVRVGDEDHAISVRAARGVFVEVD